MRITEVRFRHRLGDGRVRADASVTFDGQFVVHGFRVVDGERGLFVSMSALRGSDGTYRDMAHPITPEFRAELHNEVLEAYLAEM